MTRKICIIGAGAAGLAAIRYINASSSDLEGTVFEQTSNVGGIWCYTEKTGDGENGFPIHPSMYRGCRTNLPKEIMGYMDTPLDKADISYVPHNTVNEYLHDYADHHKLWDHIQFNSRVVRVKPVYHEDEDKGRPKTNNGEANGHPKYDEEEDYGDDFDFDDDSQPPKKWLVTVQRLQANKTEETLEFHSVIICNGHYSEPFFPDIDNMEAFQGKVLHSKDYRSPQEFAGKRVVVVGAGPSGVDISLEISEVATEVIMSIRNPPLASSFPANVRQVFPIKRALPNGFLFENDEECSCDILFLCSGFKYSYPFLDEAECQVRVEFDGKRVTPLYRHMIHPRNKLAFIGLPFMCIAFYLFSIQMRFFVKYLEGKLELPSPRQMNQDRLGDERLRRKMGLAHSRSHQLGEMQWGYYMSFAKDAGFENELRPVIRKIYDEAAVRRSKFSCIYKDDTVSIVDDETHTYINCDD